MRGSIFQNERYCSKEGQYVHIGLPFIGKGARRDVQVYYEMVREGKTDLQLAEHDFGLYARTLKATDRIRLSIRPKANGPREIILLCGYTRTGKTRWAYDNYPDLYEVPIGDDLWFDGYQQEDTVLLDEFRGQYKLTSALKVLDNYYVRRVPIKGSFTWFNPKRIILTGNKNPQEWYDYKGRREEEEALRARFTKIVEYKKGGGIVTHDTPQKIVAFWPIEGDVVVAQTVKNNYLNTPQSLNDFEVTQAIIDDPYMEEEEEEKSIDLFTM